MRQRIRLSESDLHKIIKESVKKCLKEEYDNGFVMISSKKDRETEAGGYSLQISKGIEFYKDRNNNRFWGCKGSSYSIGEKYPTIIKGIEAMKQMAKKLNARKIHNAIIILSEWETGYLAAYYSVADSDWMHVIDWNEIIRHVSDIKQNQNESKLNYITRKSLPRKYDKDKFPDCGFQRTQNRQ